MSTLPTGSRCRIPVARGGLFVVLLLLIVGGCTSPFGPREGEAAKVFVLAPRMPTAPRLDPRGARILVSRPRAASGFTGAQMIYTDTPYRLDSFARHRWADAPANMLEPLVVGTLEASGLFRQVAAAGTRTRADLRLDTELLRLVQVFSEGRSRVEIAMRVSLIGTQDSRLVDSRVLSVTEPAAELTAYAGVTAANRAVARLLDDLQTLLARIVGDD
jgi:cholesterol transport system auxiliary component